MNGKKVTTAGQLTVADRVYLQVKYGVSRETLSSIARICRDRQTVERLLVARQEHRLPVNPLWQS